VTVSADRLLEVLERAREAGFLGPGPVDAHLRHSVGFGVAAEDALGHPPANFADLGTGGGVPGLVLASRWPHAHAVFVEVGHRRAASLQVGAADLGIDERVEVVEDRAENVAGVGPYRERFEVVTARSFGPPTATAEIAAGLVRVGGVVVVSEPPERDDRRWPGEGLSRLGFASADEVEVGSAHFAVIRKVEATSPRYPRPVGRPTKRPLW
jgi:16S rRNA (guanine527-N7)-methyltransferase